MRHWHTKQSELIYVLQGEVTLVTDAGRQKLRPGMTAGFPAGKADGHQPVNESAAPAVYLEIGDRTAGDRATYVDIDGCLPTKTGALIKRTSLLQRPYHDIRSSTPSGVA